MNTNDNTYHPNLNARYPASLINQDNWLLMKLLYGPDGSISKIPFDPRTGRAVNSDGFGVPFASALSHLRPNNERAVLGYRAPDNTSPYLGLIDCDNCIDDSGTISILIQRLLKSMNTYAEYSVSGSGIHILSWLDRIPDGRNKDAAWGIEFYWQTHTIPITGNMVHLPDWETPSEILNRTSRYLALHNNRLPQKNVTYPAIERTPQRILTESEVLAVLFQEPKGSKWRQIYEGQWQGYYESPSGADLALLLKFAFYSGNDASLMESMFSASPLSQILVRGTLSKPKKWRTPKWNNRKYRERSISEAIRRTNLTYVPRDRRLSVHEQFQMGLAKLNERKQR